MFVGQMNEVRFYNYAPVTCVISFQLSSLKTLLHMPALHPLLLEAHCSKRNKEHVQIGHIHVEGLWMFQTTCRASQLPLTPTPNTRVPQPLGTLTMREPAHNLTSAHIVLSAFILCLTGNRKREQGVYWSPNQCSWLGVEPVSQKAEVWGCERGSLRQCSQLHDSLAPCPASITHTLGFQKKAGLFCFVVILYMYDFNYIFVTRFSSHNPYFQGAWPS